MARRSLPGPRLRPSPIPGSIESALDELGIQYVVRDDEASAPCPNPDHYDTHPSWSVNLITGKHNCFSCGFGGGFNRLVAVVLGETRVEANAWIRQRGGVETGRAFTERDGNHPRNGPKEITEADLALFGWPPQWALEARGISPLAAQEFGVLWDPKRELWITPVRDPFTNRLRGWQEKAEVGHHFKNVPYRMEKADTLFGYNKLKRYRRAVLIESPLDALVMFSAGVMGTCSGYGANVSPVQLDLIAETCDELVSALDDDDAGWKRSAWLKDNCPPGLALRFFDYDAAWAGHKDGRKDPGEMDDDEIWRGVDHAYSAALARF